MRGCSSILRPAAETIIIIIIIIIIITRQYRPPGGRWNKSQQKQKGADKKKHKKKHNSGRDSRRHDDGGYSGCYSQKPCRDAGMNDECLRTCKEQLIPGQESLGDKGVRQLPRFARVHLQPGHQM
jgi:hypothetical protein